MIKNAAILGLCLTAAGCDYEAGRELDRGSFGNSTLNNALVMSGDRSYAVQLANRFAQEVPPTINFDFDSATLDPQARAVLDQQATWIRQFPEVRFRVYGHTDSVGSTGYNKSLGLRRARAAVRYLSSRGISRSRLEAVVSFGETQPLIVTQGRERQNRRTVTEVSGFLENHPSLLDGKYAQVVYREYIQSAVPGTTLTEDQSLSTSIE
ncbi:OmpA family protein [Parasedimentitalea marina]|uniref:OmpA family protein n=1 Tax=Parasedimentitalea marina TaxID=2483033 RepID=A0A3T0N8E1_9RHOB|nr:OmpA family protein [Parasedimentitalea marina]AZV80306.1 OmpA family protein [Parasedimentitalea marina]